MLHPALTLLLLAVSTPARVTTTPVADFSPGPSILHISAEKTMSMVLVDGKPLTQADCDSAKACNVVDLAKGKHQLEIRGGMFAGKVLFKGMVSIPGGAEVFGKADEGSFQIYNAVPRLVDEGQVATGSLPPQGAPAASLPAGPGTIELTSGDGESFQVWIDGKHVAQFMGLTGRSITVKNVPAGEHTLEVKSFMNDRVWAKGHLYMDPGFGLKMGVTERQGLEAYNRASAWEPTE